MCIDHELMKVYATFVCDIVRQRIVEEIHEHAVEERKGVQLLHGNHEQMSITFGSPLSAAYIAEKIQPFGDIFRYRQMIVDRLLLLL